MDRIPWDLHQSHRESTPGCKGTSLSVDGANGPRWHIFVSLFICVAVPGHIVQNAASCPLGRLPEVFNESVTTDPEKNEIMKCGQRPASREPFFRQSAETAYDVPELAPPPHTRLFAVNSFHPVYNCVLTKLFCVFERNTKLIVVGVRKASVCSCLPIICGHA